jgi:hypothetical protein
VEQFGLNGMGGSSFGTNRADQGKLSFSWDDPNAQGITAPDGTVVFAVRFDIIGSAGSASHVAFSDSIALCEATINQVPVTFQPVHGHVQVAGTSSSPNPVRLAQTVFSAGSFGIVVPTVTGKTYVLEYADSIPATNWVALPPRAGNGAVQVLNDPSPQAHQRFYRLRIE